MSKKDRIRAKLDLLKLLIVAVLTALFGIIGFAMVNYKALDFVLSGSIIFGIIMLLIALFYLGLSFNKELDKIEKEE